METKSSFYSVKDLLQPPHSEKWKKLSFGCRSLDECTNGGVITRGITEICGEAGCGKSQILMQLSLLVQLPQIFGGFQKKSVIINTEGQLPSNRLIQMAKHIATQYPISVDELLDGIFINYVMHTDKMMECLSDDLVNILENNEIGLIIIDSMGAIFRNETEYVERANTLRILGHKLINIVDKFNCAVVCSNQVTSVDDKLIPCLGLAWSNQVRSRFKLEKIDNETAESSKSKTLRKFEVLFCPEIESGKHCNFVITENGVQDAQ